MFRVRWVAERDLTHRRWRRRPVLLHQRNDTSAMYVWFENVVISCAGHARETDYEHTSNETREDKMYHLSPRPLGNEDYKITAAACHRRQSVRTNVPNKTIPAFLERSWKIRGRIQLGKDGGRWNDFFLFLHHIFTS